MTSPRRGDSGASTGCRRVYRSMIQAKAHATIREEPHGVLLCAKPPVLELELVVTLLRTRPLAMAGEVVRWAEGRPWLPLSGGRKR